MLSLVTGFALVGTIVRKYCQFAPNIYYGEEFYDTYYYIPATGQIAKTTAFTPSPSGIRWHYRRFSTRPRRQPDADGPRHRRRIHQSQANAIQSAHGVV